MLAVARTAADHQVATFWPPKAALPLSPNPGHLHRSGEPLRSSVYGLCVALLSPSRKKAATVLHGSGSPLSLRREIQANLTVVLTFKRRRSAPPTTPMPRIIITHEAGSGTAGVALLIVTVTWSRIFA